MLDMGFLPDVKRVMAALPARRQTLLFSATMPASIAELAGGLLGDPVRVAVAPQATPVERIEQKVLFVAKRGQARPFGRDAQGPPHRPRPGLHTHQARRRPVAKALIQAHVRADALPRQQVPECPPGGPAALPGRTDPGAGGHRPGRPGPGREGGDPRHQLRPAQRARELRAPPSAAPPGPGPTGWHLLLRRRGASLFAGHPGADPQTVPCGGGPSLPLGHHPLAEPERPPAPAPPQRRPSRPPHPPGPRRPRLAPPAGAGRPERPRGRPGPLASGPGAGRGRAGPAAPGSGRGRRAARSGRPGSARPLPRAGRGSARGPGRPRARVPPGRGAGWRRSPGPPRPGHRPAPGKSLGQGPGPAAPGGGRPG